MSYEPSSELMAVLDALLDGTPSASQQQQLAAHLKSSPDARKYFVNYLGLHATLQWQAIELLEEADSSRTLTAEPYPTCQLAEEEPPVQSARLSFAVVGGLVAIGLASCLLWALFLIPSQKHLDSGADLTTEQKLNRSETPTLPVRTFAGVIRKSENAQWGAEGLPPLVDQLLATGSFHLLSGKATFDFFGGGTLAATGPAKITVKSDRLVMIESGNVSVSIQDEHAEMKIETPAASFLHVGTEFAVSVWPDGTSDLKVLSGAVEVHPRSGDQTYGTGQLVRKGSGFRISPAGRYETIADDSDFFHGTSSNLDSRRLPQIKVPKITSEGFLVRYVKVHPDENVALLELSLADDLLEGRFRTIEDVTTPRVPAIDFEERGDAHGAENLFPLDATFPGDKEGLTDMDDGFAIRATAVMTVFEPWIYSFLTNSDDGVRLRIDGQDVIVDDGYHRPTISIGSIPLEKGEHTIEVTYYDLHRGARLELGIAVGRCRDPAQFTLLSSGQASAN